MTIAVLSTKWGGAKVAIEDWLGLSPDAVHVHVGLLLYLGFSFVLRRRPSAFLPWVLTLMIESANELLDLQQAAGIGEMNQSPGRDHGHDSRPQRLFVIDQDDIGALTGIERSAIGETGGTRGCGGNQIPGFW